MKYVPLLILALSIPAYATKPKPPAEPVIHVKQSQEQKQAQAQAQAQQQGQIAEGGAGGSVGDVIIDVPVTVGGSNYRGGDVSVGDNIYYAPRELQMITPAAQSFEVEGVSVPTPTFAIGATQTRSDGPYGDDKSITGTLAIPITWGLKTRSSLNNARHLQESKRKSIDSAVELQAVKQKQDLAEQAQTHNVEISLLCHQLHIAGYELKDNQASPCYGKGYTDVGHTPEISDVGSTRTPGHK